MESSREQREQREQREREPPRGSGSMSTPGLRSGKLEVRKEKSEPNSRSEVGCRVTSSFWLTLNNRPCTKEEEKGKKKEKEKNGPHLNYSLRKWNYVLLVLPQDKQGSGWWFLLCFFLLLF